MRIIPTRVHGVLDYAVALILMVSPWLFRFAQGGIETWVPVAFGLTVIGYSLCTRYEFGLIPIIPVPIHLMLDAVGGLILAASPWLFGFSGVVWVPHLAAGVVAIGVAALTTPVTEPEFQLNAGNRPLSPG